MGVPQAPFFLILLRLPGVPGSPSSASPHSRLLGLPPLLTAPFSAEGSQPCLISRLPHPSRLLGVPQLWYRPSLLSPLQGSRVPPPGSPGDPQNPCPTPPVPGDPHMDPPRSPQGAIMAQLWSPARSRYPLWPKKSLPGTCKDIWGSIPESASSKHPSKKNPSW